MWTLNIKKQKFFQLGLVFLIGFLFLSVFSLFFFYLLHSMKLFFLEKEEILL